MDLQLSCHIKVTIVSPQLSPHKNMSHPTRMRSWFTSQNGLEDLESIEVSVAQPGDNEVLVKIHAVSLNYRDTEVCMGLYGHHKSISQPSSLVPCSDMCGTVVATGRNSVWKRGQRVSSIFNQTHQSGQIREKDMSSGLGLPLPGVLAEYRVFPDYGLVAVPEYLSNEEASTLPIAAVTAWMSINGFQSIGAPLRDSTITVLIQGTGGVAISGLQISKALGLKGKNSFTDSKQHQLTIFSHHHLLVRSETRKSSQNGC